MTWLKTLFLLASITGCINNNNMPTLLKQAARAYNYENYNKSITYLSEYLTESISDVSAESKYFRAMAFYYRGQARRGVLSTTDYRTIEDFNESLKYRVCMNHCDIHFEQAIINDYEAALSLRPDFFYASFHLGLERLISGDLIKAEKAFACAWEAINLNKSNAKRKLWVPFELENYKRFISYYYGMMLLRNVGTRDFETLRDIAISLSHEDGKFKDASTLFREVISGELTSSDCMALFTSWYDDQVIRIKERYFKILNEKRMAMNIANAKRFLKHYRAKHFRFIVEFTDAYSRYDLKTMNMEVGDNFLIMRSLNNNQIFQVRQKALENGFKEWQHVKDSGTWQLTGLYGKQKVTVFSGARDLPIEYCIKDVAFNEKAVLVYSLRKNVLYCVVLKNLNDITCH